MDNITRWKIQYRRDYRFLRSLGYPASKALFAARADKTLRRLYEV